MIYDKNQTSTKVIKGTVATALFVTGIMANTLVSNANLLNNGIMKNLSASQPERFPIEMTLKRSERIAKIRALKGKFAFVKTSSEAFAIRKQKEIQLEG